jgi:hypothetical protein
VTGPDALIHLRVPAALKARWVRESQSRGLKLTDWITQRVEARTMNVYKIPEALAHKYHGSGHALVAVTGEQVVDLVYLADALPDFDSDAPGALATAVADARLAPTVRRLQALGQLSFGMVSCWEFVEL